MVHTQFLREAVTETTSDRQEISWGKQLEDKKEEAGGNWEGRREGQGF